MSRGTVHVVVVNYRTPDLTLNALDALLTSILPDREMSITVVDNGSGDDSAERIRARCPGLRVIRSPRNLGFAGGNNLALREIIAAIPADTDRKDSFVLLLNSDTEVEADAIATCVRFMETHADAGIVGPKVVLPDGRLDIACRRGFPTPDRAFWKLTGIARRFPNNPRFTGYNLTHLDEDETTEVDSVVGAFMLVRQAAIDEAGLLDETFFMYGEDLDWAFRIKQVGWRVYYVPQARVRHLKGATARRESSRMIVEFYRAMWVFHFKHYAQNTVFLLNWLVAIGIILRGVVAIVSNWTRPIGDRRVA